MPELKLHRCEPEDPLRCQSGGKNGQCPYLSVQGMIDQGLISTEVEKGKLDRCPRHGGYKQLESERNKKLHQYRLQVWQQRIDEFAEGEEVKSLRGEIGITRMMIEEILNQCRDSQQLLIYSQKISILIGQAEKLVRSCDRIERTSRTMLDRSSALSFASRVVEIISMHVNDPEVIDQISNDIIDALADDSTS